MLYDRRAVNEAAGILTRSLSLFSVARVCMLNGSREDKSFVPAGSSLLCPLLFFFPPCPCIYYSLTAPCIALLGKGHVGGE